MMISRRQVNAAITQRDDLASEIRAATSDKKSFQWCLDHCPPLLRERYLIFNRIACFLEQQAMDYIEPRPGGLQ